MAFYFEIYSRLPQITTRPLQVAGERLSALLTYGSLFWWLMLVIALRCKCLLTFADFGDLLWLLPRISQALIRRSTLFKSDDPTTQDHQPGLSRSLKFQIGEICEPAT